MDILEKCEEKRLSMEEAIDNNFGYLGTCPLANRLHDELRTLEYELKHAQPETWKAYQSRNY